MYVSDIYTSMQYKAISFMKIYNPILKIRHSSPETVHLSGAVKWHDSPQSFHFPAMESSSPLLFQYYVCFALIKNDF